MFLPEPVSFVLSILAVTSFTQSCNFILIIRFFESEGICDCTMLRIMELQSHLGSLCYSKKIMHVGLVRC